MLSINVLQVENMATCQLCLESCEQVHNCLFFNPLPPILMKSLCLVLLKVSGQHGQVAKKGRNEFGNVAKHYTKMLLFRVER